MARQFLNNSTPQDKYKFFIKGVHLEQLNQDYQLLEENIDCMEETFIEKKERIQFLKEKLDRAKNLVKISDQYDGLRAKLRRLAVQMAWAQVEEEEGRLRSCEEDIRKAEEEIQESTNKVTGASNKFDQIGEALEKALTVQRDLEKELEPMVAEKEAVIKARDDAKTEVKEVQVCIQANSIPICRKELTP
jgi:structural maintenance of chromosomes protein 6